jgi:hypothetical protein
MIQIFLSEHVGKQSNKICHIKLEGMSGMGIFKKIQLNTNLKFESGGSSGCVAAALFQNREIKEKEYVGDLARICSEEKNVSDFLNTRYTGCPRNACQKKIGSW